MRKLAASLLALAVLQGCAGAQFALPQLSDAEISRAALAVPGDASDLPKIERSEVENRALVAHVMNRLRVAVPPLCAHAEVYKCSFKIRLEQQDEAKVFASSEGQIVIYAGLLNYLRAEDEVAAVIGHEIGHHLAKHVQETKDNLNLGAAIGVVVMGGALTAMGLNAGYGSAATSSQAGMDTDPDIGLISYSKDQEREADLLSAFLLKRAGYDLDHAGHALGVLTQMNIGHMRSDWFDAHPVGPERIAAWDKAVAEVDANPYKLPRKD